MFFKAFAILSLVFSTLACTSLDGPKKFNFVKGQEFKAPEIVHNRSWKEVFKRSYVLADNTVWQEAIFYMHKTRPWHMERYKFFGKEVVRIFKDYEGQRNQWVLLKKDSKWYLTEFTYMYIGLIQDFNRKENGVVLVFKDKNGDSITSTVVYRN